MEIEFIPLDYSSLEINDKSYIRIFGKTKDGKSCCIFDETENYFYVILKKQAKGEIQNILKKIEKRKYDYQDRKIKISKAEIVEKRFLGKDVRTIRVYVKNIRHMNPIAERIVAMKNVQDILETDWNAVTRYIETKSVKPLVWQKVKGKEMNNDLEMEGADSLIDTDQCLLIEDIKESEEQYEFVPKAMAFDIEAEEFEIGKGRIIMLSMSSGNFRKVLSWKKNKDKTKKQPDFVEYVKDESEMIERFLYYVKKENPDFLVGYFSDGFDLPYLRARADKHKIKLCLGLDNSGVKFKRGRIMKAKISGRIHIDMFRFIDTILSPSLRSETISLNEVAKEILGEKKVDIDFRNGIDNIDLEKFYKYNLQDSILTEKLFLKLWPNIQELVKVTQEPLFEVSRYSYSQLVESYIIHNLKRFDEISSNKPSHEEIGRRRERMRYEGAFVKQPIPGMYEGIVIFDFTSLYPSIISSFNISPISITKKRKDCYMTPEFILNGERVRFCFEKRESYIPLLIKEIINRRKAIKKQLKKKPTTTLKARSYALKTIMNAAYGYYAYFGARYYSVECAASTAAFGRHYIKKVIQTAENNGFDVIYGDTDSIAIHLNKKTKQEALEFLKRINQRLPGEMELELEDFYKRGIFVSKRTVQAGAKKKYALINEKEKIKIRGFETVRRDWCSLAKEVQDNVIKMTLKDGNEKAALEYLKKIIKKIEKREIDKREVIIKTQLKKPIEEYRAISPHVVVAKKMKEHGLPVQPGSLIEYFIAEAKSAFKKGKKLLVRERARLPNEKGDYDISYYLQHQIIPAVENIFEIFDVDVKEIADGKGQKKLGQFR